MKIMLIKRNTKEENKEPIVELVPIQGDYKVFVDGAELMKLYLTCHSCPEQYDLRSLLDNKYIAYFRLRYSNFIVKYYTDGDEDGIGECVYDEYISRSGFDGNFETDEQRIEHLTKAIKIIVKKMRGEEQC